MLNKTNIWNTTNLNNNNFNWITHAHVLHKLNSQLSTVLNLITMYLFKK